jgi:hypothetical protein
VSLSGVDSYPKVEFNFNYVHLSEPIVEGRLEAKTVSSR